MFPGIFNSGIPPMAASPLQQALLGGGQTLPSAFPTMAPSSDSTLQTLTMVLLLQNLLGSSGSSSSSPLSSFAALLGGSDDSSSTQKATASKNTGPLVIAQIDQFSTDNNGFNHGDAVADEITDGGEKINLLQFDVSGGNTTANIANSLETIIAKVKNGERIDAVNLSQQDFSSSADTQRVQQAIDELEALGVPVAVAAGNQGPNARNQLASDNAFIVESDNKATSGTGNISAEGKTTSFAAANLTPLLAKLHAQGLSVDEIRDSLT